MAIALTLSLMVQPIYAESGFWDQEIGNLAGSSKYRIYYEAPDTILTNITQVVKVTFVILQLGGLAKGIETKTIVMQLSANGKSLEWTIAQEVRELDSPGDTWGPIAYTFKVLDSDFGLNPKEAVSATISITVQFKEITTHFGEYDHETKKTDISTELTSTTIPTSIDYLKQVLQALGGTPLPIASLAIVLTLAISVTIAVKVTFRRSIRI